MTITITITEEQHTEALEIVQELVEYVAAGYAAPSDVFSVRLARLNEILWGAIIE